MPRKYDNAAKNQKKSGGNYKKGRKGLPKTTKKSSKTCANKMW